MEGRPGEAREQVLRPLLVLEIKKRRVNNRSDVYPQGNEESSIRRRGEALGRKLFDGRAEKNAMMKKGGKIPTELNQNVWI